MPIRFWKRPRVGRTQTALLLLLLVIALAVTGLLAYEGQKADAQRLRAYETLLRDHAAFGADGYKTMVQSRVMSFLKLAFDAYPMGYDSTVLTQHQPTKFHPMYAVACACNPDSFVRNHFGYDYRTGKLYSDAALTPVARERVAEFIRTAELNSGMRYGWKGALLDFDDRTMMALNVRLMGPETNAYAVGFTIDRAIFSAAFFPPIDTFNLMVPRDESLPARKDAFHLAVSLRDAVIHSGGGAPSAYVSTKALPKPFGGFVISASVNSEAALAVAGTGSKRSFFVTLVLLAGCLMITAMVLMRRTSELSEARSDFVSNVSHELRTPLAQIRMFTETLMLGRTRNDAERRRSLEIIDQEAKRLTALVDNVLQLARGERGAARVNASDIPLAPALHEIVDSFRQLPRARSVEIRTEFEERLIATVDPGALRQIVNNLLDNAIKYGPSAQRIHVGMAMFEEHARLWVDDEGPGIPVRERERIFEAFYRSTTQVDRVAGSGIGLAVVRELTGLLNGRVWAEEAPGGGARIIVEFRDAYLRPEEAAAGGIAVA